MTANAAGKLAADGLYSSLRTLRDHWVLLVFLASALIWARDIYEDFVDLPARVVELKGLVTELRADIARLDGGPGGHLLDRSPALTFPGAKHRVADGRAGASVTVRYQPAVPVRAECQAGELAAYMIDAAGLWYAVETDLVRLPMLDGAQELAFGVQIHPRMIVGRAQFLAQVTLDCGSHRQVDRLPRLHFRVLGQEADTLR